MADTTPAPPYYNTGSTYSVNDPISNTTTDPLYQSERYKAMIWNIPVPNPGDYEVSLHFAEIYLNNAGGRIFDVLAEGTLVLDDYDPFAAAGGKYAGEYI